MAVRGFGLSSRARQINDQFLSSTASTFNAIFSLNVGTTSSVEALQLKIKALRASLPESQVLPELLQDDGGVSSSSTGKKVNTSA
ncbi:MAG: hypothetical protein H7831_03160 [Magnetococcus sp. WYHC-3]